MLPSNCVIPIMQRFIIAKDEQAVLNVKFLTSQNDIVKIHEDESPQWISSNTDVFTIISSNYDKTNYNVLISAQNTGNAVLMAGGWFLGNDLHSESDYLGYSFTGSCEIEVRPALVKQTVFTMSHKILKN